MIISLYEVIEIYESILLCLNYVFLIPSVSGDVCYDYCMDSFQMLSHLCSTLNLNFASIPIISGEFIHSIMLLSCNLDPCFLTLILWYVHLENGFIAYDGIKAPVLVVSSIISVSSYKIELTFVNHTWFYGDPSMYICTCNPLVLKSISYWVNWSINVSSVLRMFKCTDMFGNCLSLSFIS